MPYVISYNDAGYAIAPTLGDMRNSVIRMRWDNVTWLSDDGYLGSQAGGSPGSREFGLFRMNGSLWCWVYGADPILIDDMSVAFPGGIEGAVVELTVTPSTGDWSIDINGQTWSGNVYIDLDSFNLTADTPLRFAGRGAASGPGTDATYLLNAGDMHGDWRIWLDDVLVRHYEIPSDASSGVIPELVEGSDATIYNLADANFVETDGGDVVEPDPDPEPDPIESDGPEITGAITAGYFTEEGITFGVADGTGQVNEPTDPVDPNLEPWNIVLLGASIILQTAQDQAAIDDFKAKFAAHGIDATIYNHGANGMGTSWLRDTISSRISDYDGQQSNTLFIVHTAGNDISGDGPYPGGADEINTNYRQILNDLINAGFYVLPSSTTYRIPPASNPSEPYNTNIIIPAIQDIVPNAMAGARPLLDLYTLTYDNQASWYVSDGIHPSSAGEEQTRQYLADSIATYIPIMNDEPVVTDPPQPTEPLPDVTGTNLSPKNIISLKSEADERGHYVRNKFWLGMNMTGMSSYTPRIFINYIHHTGNEAYEGSPIPNAEGYYSCEGAGDQVNYYVNVSSSKDMSGDYVIYYRDRQSRQLNLQVGFGAAQLIDHTITDGLGRMLWRVSEVGYSGNLGLIQNDGDLIEAAYVPAEFEQNYLDGEIFLPQFIADQQGFEMFRFMDWLRTNNKSPSLPEHFERSNTRDWGQVADIELLRQTVLAFDQDTIWYNAHARMTLESAQQQAENLRDLIPAHVKILWECSNEPWNGGAPFVDNSKWLHYADVEAHYITYLGNGRFSAPPEMTPVEGERIKTFRMWSDLPYWDPLYNPDHKEPYTNWRDLRVENLVGNEFDLVQDSDGVLVAPDADTTGALVKQIDNGSLSGPSEGAAYRINELYPIFKAVLGDRVECVGGTQYANPWQTSQYAIAFDHVDHIADAPYWSPYYENIPDLATATDEEITEQLIGRHRDKLIERFPGHVRALGKDGIINYEFNSHFGPDGWTTAEDIRLADYLSSAHYAGVMEDCMRMLSSIGYRGGCYFSDYTELVNEDGTFNSEWGAQDWPGAGGHRVEVINKFRDMGGVPRGGVDFGRSSYGGGVYSITAEDMPEYNPDSIFLPGEIAAGDPIVYTEATAPSGAKVDLHVSPTGIPWMSPTTETGQFTFQTLNADDTWTAHTFEVQEVAGTLQVTGVSSGTIRPGDPIVFSYTGAAGSVSVSTAAGPLLVVSDDGSSVSVTCPELSEHGNRTLNYGDVVFTVSDGTTSDNIAKYITGPDGWYYGQITEIHADGAYANDTGVEVGHWGLAYRVSGIGDFDAATGLITTDPNDPALFGYKVYDGVWQSEFADAGYTQPTTNAPPVVSTIPTQSITAGDSVNIDIWQYVSDDDNDNIVITKAAGDAGLSISGARYLVGSIADAGQHVVGLEASDGVNDPVQFTVQFEVEAVNEAPTVSAFATQSVMVGEGFNIDTWANISDPEGDVVSVTRTGGTTQASVTGGRYVTGAFNAAGTYTINLLANDGQNTTPFDITFSVDEEAQDGTPDGISFSAIENAQVNQQYSATAAVTGMSEGATLEITSGSGQLSNNGGSSWTSSPVSFVSGQTLVRVVVTTGANYEQTYIGSVTLNSSVSGALAVTTAEAPYTGEVAPTIVTITTAKLIAAPLSGKLVEREIFQGDALHFICEISNHALLDQFGSEVVIRPHGGGDPVVDADFESLSNDGKQLIGHVPRATTLVIPEGRYTVSVRIYSDELGVSKEFQSDLKVKLTGL